MKRPVVLASWVLVLAAVAGTAAFAQQTYKFQIPGDFEPIYGTWVNPEHAGTSWKTLQKIIYYSWGYSEGFKKVTDEKPFNRCTFILVEKWTDSKGNTWYRELDQGLGAKYYLLTRISKDGKTMEQIFRSTGGFPSESDLGPGYTNYWKYQRQ